jgi:hypothetical protein
VPGLRTIAEKAKNLGVWISTARNLVWLIVAILVAIIVLGRYVGRYEGLVPSIFQIAIFAAGATLGGIAGWFAARRRFGLPDYAWVSAEYSLTFEQDDILRQSQVTKAEIRILKDHVHLFGNRYAWTGSGPIRLSVLSEGHRLLGEIRQPHWRYYYVLIENPQPKGSTTTVVVRHDLYDSGRESQPMVAKDVIEPVEHLTLRAVFPASARPARVIASEMVRSRTAGAEWRVKSQEVVPVADATGEVVYQPPQPAVGHRYEIRWEWPPSTAVSPAEGVA